ncbi:hypothetical protein LEN26_021122 [Aphanomyces euteiches]|nr:hypothetical protein LEN26_021122 [Aphanomyces euteiches]KAH9125450.1 hypothetical protein AeMF1_003927 [Aphanomyces euteiches]KAH9189999.1 hypothetical protein AeNC1_008026 [Aphanomyces euteiches]
MFWHLSTDAMLHSLKLKSFSTYAEVPDENEQAVARRNDIRRATSMRDLRVRTFATERGGGVGVSKVYEVEIENCMVYNSVHWKLYVWFGDFRAFYNRVKRVKGPELHAFRKQARGIMLRGLFGDKALCITRLLRLIFDTLGSMAEALSDCPGARQLLHFTDEFCQMEYPRDHSALTMMQQMKSVVHRDDADMCCICLADANCTSQRVALRCGHEFHEACICIWFYSRLNCPICRQ